MEVMSCARERCKACLKPLSPVLTLKAHARSQGWSRAGEASPDDSLACPEELRHKVDDAPRELFKGEPSYFFVNGI